MVVDIEKFKKELDKDLVRFIRFNKDEKYFISHPEFELFDILKLSPSEVNNLFSVHKLKLNEFREQNKLKEYILCVPEIWRVYTFGQLTYLKKPGQVLYINKWGELRDEEYWKTFRFLWKECSKNVNRDREDWFKIFSQKRNGKEYFMNESEREFFHDLPIEFTIYKGYVGEDFEDNEISTRKPSSLKLNFINTDRLGFSYTLSREIGLKYLEIYKKYNRKEEKINTDSFRGTYYVNYISRLFEGKIKKEQVLGYFNEKGEEEIIVIPDTRGEPRYIGFG